MEERMYDFLSGGGEMGARIRAHDWSSTPLGDFDSWPQSLRSALSICLNSSFPTAIYWGPELTLLYNDAWSHIPAERHPWALGRHAQDVWDDIWDVVGPQFDQVRLTGVGLSTYDQPLALRRDGVVTETWWNYSLTPVRGESEEVAGIFNQGHETTQVVVTARQRQIDAAQQQRMFEQAPGFMTILRGPEHVFEFVNIAFRRLFGNREFIGKTIRQAFPELANQGFYEWLDRVYTTGERFVSHHTPIQLDYSGAPTDQRFLDFIYEPLTDEAGNVIGIFCEGHDVTEAHLLHTAMEASERRFRAALEIQTVGAIYCNQDGLLTDANDAFLRMSGYSREELLDNRLSWQNLTPPEWMTVSVQAINELKARGETTPYEKEYLRKDGSRWWALFAAKQLPDGTIFEFVIDTTDRVVAETALREESRTLETLNRVSTKLAGNLDVQQVAQAVTQAGMELFDAHAGAYLRIEPDADPQDPRPDSHVFGALQGETALYTLGAWPGELLPACLTAVVESRTGRALGRLMFAHRTAGHFTERHDQVIKALAAKVAIALDNARLFQEVQRANETLERRVAERTTELIEVHEALRQAQKMEAVGQLTGGIAHDFNNLLAGIMGSLELIEQRIGQQRTVGIDRFIKGALTSAQRAAALTQRLLAFARRQTLDPKPTDVNRLVLSMEELIRRTVGPSISVNVVERPDLWAASLDAAQLESALLNLAINARDAMPHGGRITIETHNRTLDRRVARAHDLPAGQYLVISVTDNGTGIPKHLINRIFDPFFTTKPLGQGTGLGLSMIHGFVRQSGGQVRVYSEVDVGTTVSLYLPRYEGEVTPEGLVEEQAIATQGTGQTVLVIDDEETVRMLIVEVLEDAGYNVLQAADGPAGLRILESGVQVDLLLTDVGLPGGMNGRQVADAARVRRPELKVLFITGFAENAAVGNGYLEPDMEVLTKPFVMAQLAGKVSEMIEGRGKA
jgi:PAS domain S-box-containing protein